MTTSSTRMLWVGLALAVIVRLPTVFLESGVTTRFSRIGDSYGYHLLAKNLAKSGTLTYGTEPTAFREPFYPLFLAGLYKISGGSLRAMRLAQSIVFLAVVVVAFRLGVLVGGARTGNLAAIGTALYPSFLHYSLELLTESLAIVFIPLCYGLFLEFQRRPRISLAAAIGVAGASALMLRPPMAVVLGAMISWIAWTNRAPDRRSFALKAIAVLVLTIGILFLPWVVRNALQFGAFIPFDTRGGFALYEGVTEYRVGDYADRVAHFRAAVGYHRSDIERPGGPAGLDQIAIDRRARDLAFEEIRERPVRFVRTLLVHLGKNLAGVLGSDLRDLARGRIPLTVVAGTLPYWFVWIGSIAWLRSARGEQAERGKLLLVFGVLALLPILPFAASIRYRVPVLDLPLIVLTSAALAARGRHLLPRIPQALRRGRGAK